MKKIGLLAVQYSLMKKLNGLLAKIDLVRLKI